MNLMEKWKNTVLKNYQAKNTVSELELELVLSYLATDPEKFTIRSSYPDVLKKAQKWQKRSSKIEGKVKVIHSFANGYKWVELLDEKAKEYEGELMGNCINGEHFNNYAIYSLRNKNNIPCLDLQVEEGEVSEVKGKSNTMVKEKYLTYIEELLPILEVKMCDEYLFISSFGFTEIHEEAEKKLSSMFTGFKVIKRFNHSFISGELKLKKNQLENLTKELLTVANYDFYSYLQTFGGLSLIKKVIKIMWENQKNTTDFIHLAACNKNKEVVDYCFKMIDKIRKSKSSQVTINKINYAKNDYRNGELTIEMEECPNGELYEEALTTYISENKKDFDNQTLYQLFTGLASLYKSQQIYNILFKCEYDVNELTKTFNETDWVEEKSFVTSFLRLGLKPEYFWKAYEAHKFSKIELLLKVIDLNPSLFKQEYMTMIDEDDTDEYAGKMKNGPKIRAKLLAYGIKM